MKPWITLIFGILFGLFASGLILLISQPNQGDLIQLLPAPTPTRTFPPEPTPSPEPILCQISGEVNQPGIYPIFRGARLADLIELAGGVTLDADQNRINLAVRLNDGDYYYLPRVDEQIPETATNAPSSSKNNQELEISFPLNINTATQEELELIPGIGPTKAAEILAYREKLGEYSDLEELLNVPGIGPTSLESLLEYLTIEP